MVEINKEAFFKLCNYVPHPGQEQLHAAVDEPGVYIIVAMCGTRFGKTWAAAYEMCYQAMLPRDEFLGWCVAPQIQLANIVFDQIIKIIMTLLKGNITRIDHNDGNLEFTNMGGGRSRIQRRTAQGADGKGRLAGAGVHFMVIDEASSRDFKDSVWYSELSSRTSNTGGKTLMISTPRGVRGFFISLFRSGKRGDNPAIFAMSLPSWKNTHAFPGGYEGEAIQRQKTMLKNQTGNDAQFMQEYAASPMSQEGVVFEPELLEPNFVLDNWEEPIASAEYGSGLDLATTRDCTVHTIVRAPLGFKNSSPQAKVVFVRRMFKMPVAEQIRLVREDQDRYGIHAVWVDGTGMGDPIVQQAINAGIYVRKTVFTNQSKMEMIGNLKSLLQRGFLRLPKASLCPSLVDEMLTYEWDGNGANAPSGFHDDHVCSLMLAANFFPAGGTQGEGQVFHHNMVRQEDDARDSSVKVRRIGPSTSIEAPQVFSPKSGPGGLRFGNEVLGWE